MQRIVLRPATPLNDPYPMAEVITYETEKGFVTPCVHGRTRKWHATKTQPTILSDGWPDMTKLGPAYRTKREALAALD